jgi:hypothetical protein
MGDIFNMKITNESEQKVYTYKGLPFGYFVSRLNLNTEKSYKDTINDVFADCLSDILHQAHTEAKIQRDIFTDLEALLPQNLLISEVSQTLNAYITQEEFRTKESLLTVVKYILSDGEILTEKLAEILQNIMTDETLKILSRCLVTGIIRVLQGTRSDATNIMMNSEI